MQLATILLNIGGDAGNQVEKYDVTPSEVHVLQMLHGEDAVTEININGDVKRTSKSERERLTQTYSKAQPDGTLRSPIVDMLFPGVAARLYENFDEMELDDHFFKAERVSTRKARDPLDHDGDGAKGGTKPAVDNGLKGMTVAELKTYAEDRGIDLGDATKKADVLAKIEAATPPAEEAEEDGIEDMPDGNQALFN